MWDLSVPGGNDHDFYIDTVASAVLVHNCPSYPTTAHGAERLAAAGFDDTDIALIKAGQSYEQANGGIAYVWQTGPDSYINLIIENDEGDIVTAHRGMTLDDLNGLARNYRWAGWP